MKLTLAFGFQYDNAQTIAHSHSQNGAAKADESAVVAEIVSEAVNSELPSQLMEYSFKYGVSFLTYTLQGIPAPIREEGSSIDLYI